MLALVSICMFYTCDTSSFKLASTSLTFSSCVTVFVRCGLSVMWPFLVIPLTERLSPWTPLTSSITVLEYNLRVHGGRACMCGIHIQGYWLWGALLRLMCVGQRWLVTYHVRGHSVLTSTKLILLSQHFLRTWAFFKSNSPVTGLYTAFCVLYT